jgi:CubicO group peptidase (beta-lactamase class C family)
VLGRLIEIWSGKSFETFLAERVFQPLDMKDTGFFVPKSKADRFTANYGHGGPGKLRQSMIPSRVVN